MEFQEKLKEFAKKVPALVESAQTEEATKMSLIMPFFNMLGYNIFDPTEFCPEFTADVGIKKKEKVDFAIVNLFLSNILKSQLLYLSPFHLKVE